MTKPTLYYIHDPMCSWCWGFRKVWNLVQQELKDKLNIQFVLGGLAPDSDEIMSNAMQKNIQFHWKNIQQKIPETEFNFDFWNNNNKPRRSTYSACRAIISARLQGEQFESMMLFAIQKAYYLNAKNPSDDSVLIQLAKEIGLDVNRFIEDLNSDKSNYLLQKDLELVNFLQVSGFPSLVLKNRDSYYRVSIDYTNPKSILKKIWTILDDS